MSETVRGKALPIEEITEMPRASHEIGAITALEQLRRILPDSFDLVIDDGLYSPSANGETLRFGINVIKQGGWVVIEDIVSEAVPIGQVAAALLPPQFSPHIFKAREAVMFGVRRLS